MERKIIEQGCPSFFGLWGIRNKKNLGDTRNQDRIDVKYIFRKEK